MRASLAVLLLVLLLHLCGVPKPVDAGFIQEPEDVTAPLNTNATFECSHTDAEVIWRVDTIQISTSAAIGAFASMRKVFVINDGLSSSTLVVLASAENNQTVIECLGFITGTNPELSGPVTVTVFDLPSAPSSLALSVNAAQQLRLTWSPPYTLPGEDITYSVQVENLNTTSVFENITNTEFIFNQPAEDEDCNLYQFTVFTVNAVGQSAPSNAENSTIPVVPGQVSGISTSVSLDGGVSVTLVFESPDVCPDYPVLTYNVTARNKEGIVTPLGWFPSTGTMETFTSNSSIGLEENTVYTATVVAENIVGRSTSSEVTFYTSDVQTAVVESLDSQSLRVTCTFAVGTQSRGCRVQILLTNDPENPYYTLNIRSTDNPLVAEATDAMQFPSEAFEVLAFDWESDGSISSFGVPVQVIGGPIPPSSATPGSSTSLSTSLPTSPLISQGTTVEPSLTPSVAPTFSPALSPTLPPTPSNVITTSNSQGSSSSPSLVIIIIGCVVGAVVLLLVAIVVVNIIICAARRNRKGKFPVKEDGRDSRSSSHVYFKEPGGDSELVPPVIYEPIPACEPGRRELVPSPTYPHPPATLNPTNYSEYEVMSPSYKAEVRYAVPTGRPVDGQAQTEVGTPLYEVISTKRGVANGTSHGTNGVSLVAPNPQYGETVAATSRSDGGVFAIARKPPYGDPTSQSDAGVFTGPRPPWPYGESPPVSPQSVVLQYPPGTSRSDSGMVTTPFNRQYSAPTSSSASGVVAVASNPQYGEIGEFTSQHSIANV